MLGATHPKGWNAMMPVLVGIAFGLVCTKLSDAAKHNYAWSALVSGCDIRFDVRTGYTVTKQSSVQTLTIQCVEKVCAIKPQKQAMVACCKRATYGSLHKARADSLAMLQDMFA